MPIRTIPISNLEGWRSIKRCGTWTPFTPRPCSSRCCWWTCISRTWCGFHFWIGTWTSWQPWSGDGIDAISNPFLGASWTTWLRTCRPCWPCCGVWVYWTWKKEWIDGKIMDNCCKMDLQLVQSSRPQNLFCWVRLPTHASPPLKGPIHVLERPCWPLPQLPVHCVHAPQGAQNPFTLAVSNLKWAVKRALCISEFFCHSNFTSNQFWRILKF